LGSNKGILFLHGALHLFVEDGEVRKHSWIRTNKRLIELIKEGFLRKRYPLFVAEGKSNRKFAQIQRNGYLSYCLAKLGRIQDALVIYGHSLAETDQHILETIADNVKLKHIYVGLHGDQNSSANRHIKKSVNKMVAQRAKILVRRRFGEELIPQYYSSESASVWDAIGSA
jgi:hypothetical protein